MALVEVEYEDNIAVITLNRPEAMNALSMALREQLAMICGDIRRDDKVRAAVLTGAGERAFTAGLDLKELGSDSGTLSRKDMTPEVQNPALAIAACAKPVVGAINGVAITGGLELALGCDILIASENARFADTHVRVGVMPGWGLSQKLSRLIGISRAKEMSLSGNFVDAQTASEWGLVNRVVPTEELLNAAKQLARDIASADPAHVAFYKGLIDEGYGMNFADAMAMEDERSRRANAQVSGADVEAQRQKVLERGRGQ